MRINTTEKEAIEAALLAANGKSTAHTYTCAATIAKIAAQAEKAIAALGLPVALRKGARYTSTSGGSVARSYSYSRTATRITLERGSSAWYMVAASSVTIYADAGRDSLSLTATQDTEAVSRFRKQYYVPSREAQA